MIEINLLPRDERKARHDIPLGAMSIVLFFVGATVILAMLYLNNVRIIGKKRTELVDMTNKKKRYEKYDKEYNTLDKKLKEIQSRFDLLAKLDKGRTFAPQLMEDIAIRLPDSCWLTSVELNSASLTLNGGGTNNYLISDFAESLERSDFMETVSIEEVKEMKQKIGGEDMDVSTFLIRCTIKKEYR